MNGKHRGYYISLAIRLGLLVVIVIYLIFDVKYNGSDSMLSLGLDAGNTAIGERLQEQRNNSVERELDDYEIISKANEKYQEQMNEIDKYVSPDEPIEIYIDDIEIPKYSTVQELDTLGFKAIGLHENVYALREMYGDLLEHGEQLITYSCTNLNTSDTETKDCILSGLIIDNNVTLKVGQSSIEIGSNLVDIISSLDGYNLQEYDAKESKIYHEYDNVVYDLSTGWMVQASTSEEMERGIATEKFILRGTEQNGLESVEYDLTITTLDMLIEICGNIKS